MSELLGGKGVNLVWLRDQGFNVPEFAVLPTSEYEEFVSANGLAEVIEAALAGPNASTLIREAFAAAPVSPAQRARLLLATSGITRPVAVRSSATAEDLPDASFAGQQDTFLNVHDDDALIDAIVACWSSLWTSRAITYRERVDLTGGLALAVVVQAMVQPDASGVLFTANPLTGHRSETVIEAVPGLGDALVSGQVIPDSFTLVDGAITESAIQQDPPTLSSRQAIELARLGREVAAKKGMPQDIEWVRTGDQFHLVQTRAITNLFPLPDGAPKDSVWISFGAFQGMLAPITPLGSDVLRSAMAGIGGAIGRRVDWKNNPFVRPAGQRLWVRIDPALRTKAVRRGVGKFLTLADPATSALVIALLKDRELAPVRRLPNRGVLAGSLKFFSGILARVPKSLRRPEAARRRVEETMEHLVSEVVRRVALADDLPDPVVRLNVRSEAATWLANEFFPQALRQFGPVMVPSALATAALRQVGVKHGVESASLRMWRSMPGNVTTAMDLALFDVAQQIRDDPAAADRFAAGGDLAAEFLAGDLPEVAQRAVAGFLRRYGMRGVAEIDLGAPRWADDPSAVLATISSYLANTDERSRPDLLYAAGVADAEVAIEEVATKARFGAPVRKLAKAVRGMFGARETPKFGLVRALGVLREALLESADDLVAAGRISNRADVFFLHLDELPSAFDRPWHSLIAERRDAWDRERRRGGVPRVMLGDGRTFYEGIGVAADTEHRLHGAGVSPGVAEGLVRVVFDPAKASLEPGEVLVCPGTDPAWTPLFLSACALVTEVGGLMTHGSVVAREYGLPAVVGVHDATTVLQTGQRVRIDGTAGTIDLLD